MSNVLALCGLSNSGKSTSIKYLDPNSTFIISCTNKQLQIPGFRKKYPKFRIEEKKPVGNWFVSTSYEQIEKIMDVISTLRPDVKVLVIDDMNYLMSNESMVNSLVKGYEKFTIMGKNYYDLITKAQELRDDLTVVLISHIINNGTDLAPEWRMFTLGKLLNNTVNIDGLFSYIIYSERYVDDTSDEVKYRFRTKTNGDDTCRSPEGCFEDKYIEPNLKTLIDRVNQFENDENE